MNDIVPDKVIEVQGLTCGYGEEVILRDVSFAVARGEAFFIIGESGCGKSTLLRCLIGLLKPEAGRIAYFGKSFLDSDTASRRELLRSFGVLYQSNALWSALTLAENVTVPLEEHTSLSPREREEVVSLKLSQVGLAGFGHLYPAELSGGMQKRAALARALALDPAIVFFDEPTSGLDPVTARTVDQLILQVCESMGTTMVIVSHKLASIFRLADRLILLNREAKGIIAQGDPDQLAAYSTDPRVQNFLRAE